LPKDNLSAARRLRDLFKEGFKFLAANPLMGELREDLGADLQIFSVSSYVIVYYPETSGIAVSHVLHGARDIAALLSRSQ
jgi:plasmid stabilization system protein ParE